MDKTAKMMMSWTSLVVGVALLTAIMSPRATAQDQDDPPGRVARLGYMQGSVSFQPAGESDWVQAVSNRPMTTGDQLWADQDSRAEVELGSAVIRMAANTGFSFLNLDDRTVQIQLTVVVTQFTFEGTNDGPLGSLPPSGRQISQPFCEVCQLDEQGRVVSGGCYYDQYTLLTQLGHIQPLAAAA